MHLNNFVQDIARESGAIIKDNFRGSYSRRGKGGGGDVVTEIDERSEAHVIDRIRREYPDSRILSEEAGVLGPDDAEMTWIIDPLDGTRNYAEGIPFFSVSIAMLLNGRPEIGLVHDPIHDELFFARRGEGAFRNGGPIRVSEETSLEDGIVNVSWVRRKTDRSEFVRYVDEISRHTSYFRRFGSAALSMAYVACGRMLAYMQGGLNPWDVAGGVVLIQEAGGLVTDFTGAPIDLSNSQIDIVTANPVIHATLMRDVIKSPSL